MNSATAQTLPLEDALQLAIAHHQAGRLPEAEQLYRAILQARPEQPDANHNLGLLALQIGQPALGLPYLKNALESNPSQEQYVLSYANALLATAHAAQASEVLQAAIARGVASAQIWNNLGSALHGLGSLGDAADSYRQALRQAPDYQDAWFNLGSVLQDIGQFGDAAAGFRCALALKPDFAEAYNNLGIVLRDLGKNHEAALSFQHSLDIRRDDAGARYNLGNVLLILGRSAIAADNYRLALAGRPDYAEAYDALGVALRKLGQDIDAELSHRRALVCQPDFADALHHLGNTLCDLGLLVSAGECFRRILAINPGDADALNNLGILLLDSGKPEEAMACYRHALAYRPDFAPAYNNLGNALRVSGQVNEALANCQYALTLEPAYAEAHNNLANVLFDLGRLEEAVSSYRHALAIKPVFAEAHNNLGNALRSFGTYDDAIASYEQALRISPAFPEIHTNMAIAMKLQSRIAEAETSCRKALEITPDFVEALTCLAALHADKGQFAQAENLFWRAIAVSPDLPEAWAGIARTRKMTGDDHAWLQKVEKIADLVLQPSKEASLRYSLGKYYDDVKNFERAFLNYQRANELAKLFSYRYVRQDETQLIDRLIRLYDAEWINRPKQGNQSARPIWVVGMPRSGTSLAEQILASHPKIFGAGELAFWASAAPAHERVMLAGNDGDDLMRKLADDYLQVLLQFSPDALRVIDKVPGNFHCLGLLHAAFPNAKIIHMQRNPVDTCLSIYFQNFEMSHTYANDLEDIGHYYLEYLRIMRHWHAVLPAGTILDVPYEGLVDEQEFWSRRMVDAVGMPWDARCIDFQNSVRAVGTASNWQVRQKISKSSVERWRNYEKFLEPLQSFLNTNKVVNHHESGGCPVREIAGTN